MTGEMTTARTRESILAEVFLRISAGASVASVCIGEDYWPSHATFWRWIAEDKAQADLYKLALQSRAHVFAEELANLADDASGDYMQTDDGPRYDPENVARSKLRVNTRQWIISRLLPKTYGDKLEVEATGAPFVIQITETMSKL